MNNVINIIWNKICYKINPKSDNKAIYSKIFINFAINLNQVSSILNKMINMKNLVIISFAVVALVFGSCNNSNGTKTGDMETHNIANEEQVSDIGNDDGDKKEGKVIMLTKEIFIERVWNYEKNPDTWVYEGDLPCMIDFYADWCKPCKLVAPIMDELAEEYKGKIYVYKIDTQVERELAQVFQVTSIPRVLFVPKKGQPQMSVGALPKPTFVQAIEEVLLAK